MNYCKLGCIFFVEMEPKDSKDKRYINAKGLIESGDIKHFRDIFLRDIIKRNRVAKDLGFNFNRFDDLVQNTDGWILQDIYRMAALFEVDEKVMFNLLHDQRIADKQHKKKSS